MWMQKYVRERGGRRGREGEGERGEREETERERKERGEESLFINISGESDVAISPITEAAKFVNWFILPNLDDDVTLNPPQTQALLLTIQACFFFFFCLSLLILLFASFFLFYFLLFTSLIPSQYSYFNRCW